ncbi:MAG: hypothetical protein WC479_02840 [Candidatus Izemoplasmatales bacterium]
MTNDKEVGRIFCVSCKSPLMHVELNGVWGMCQNKDCPRVGLLSGVSLTVKKKNDKNPKKSNK